VDLVVEAVELAGLSKSVAIKFALMLFFITNSLHCLEKTSAITTAPTGGRFGDHLLLYYEAKYLAWYLDLPFLYIPFQYSNLLNLHNKELQYKKEIIKRKYTTKKPASKALLKLDPQTLYEASFHHPVIPTPQRQEAEFLKHMRDMISPRTKIAEIAFPKNILTLAVHVRKGGGFDEPLISRQEYTPQDVVNAQYRPIPQGNFVDLKYLTKLPPDQYYIDQIKRVSEMFDDAPMYLFIFTDDENPEAIKERYRNSVNKHNIIFDSRKNNNDYKTTLIDDFFSMTKFDCLIRPCSTLSMMVERIGFCKLAIFPKRAAWHGDILVVEEVETLFLENNARSSVR
jgi:hypothetical protein